jgi:hypothetical protein
LSTYFKRRIGCRSKRTTFRLFRAAGETETTQENIQYWLEPDEGDPGFQLLTMEKIAADVIKILLWEKTLIIN